MNSPTKFSAWMRDNLKDAYSGLITQDIDFIITNQKNNYFIVEEKNSSSARTSPAQAVTYKMISDILSSDERFLGCHKATLEPTGVYLDQNGKLSVDEFIENPNKFKFNKYGQTWFDKVLYFNLKYLWDGTGVPPKRKTEKEHTSKRESLLLPELDLKDVGIAKIDWVFVNYVSGYFALFSESDCFYDDVVNHIINMFDKYNLSDKPAFNPKSHCKYKFLGAYSISYNDDMSLFRINGKPIDKNDFIKVMNLDDENLLKFKIN